MKTFSYSPYDYYRSRHGFSSVKSNHGGFNAENVDEILDGYIKQLLTNLEAKSNWDILKMILERFSVLISDEEGKADLLKWFEIQSYNPELGINALYLIRDTLMFIRDRRRPISLPSRVAIIENRDPEVKFKEDIAKTAIVRKEIRAILKQLSRDADKREFTLFHWVNNPYGYIDFVRTIKVFFGSRM